MIQKRVKNSDLCILHGSLPDTRHNNLLTCLWEVTNRVGRSDSEVESAEDVQPVCVHLLSTY